MQEFWNVLRRFALPYKKFMLGAIIANLLSAILNIFSFMSVIPMLNLLFGMDTNQYAFMPWDGPGNMKDIVVNNLYYYTSQLMEQQGAQTALLAIGAFLIVTTFIKTLCYFIALSMMVPLRTGVVRDIRMIIYEKVLHLPLSFLSEERKGDIITRMSSDVAEVENSITSSLDALIKNPILIIFYFGTLIIISWKLTLFTITVVPLLGIIMARIGKKLKSGNLAAQNKWSETMSQLEETLGGMRIIKAFIAEDKMFQRFLKASNEYRDSISRVSYRQVSAHPVSEFLGTTIIVVVLWFGGSLIFSDQSPIDAPTFIFYMIILYSVINPLKEVSKAGYTIPRGLASMERIDKILLTENPIKNPANPAPAPSLKHQVEFCDVHFTYPGSSQEVIRGVSFTVPQGKTIALVGQSGSGKSTLVDLLPRYHDVTDGKILIDGTDIRQFRIHDLRDIIGNVNQEAILFNDTFFNNIAFGVPNATMEEVIEAAKIANAHEFIMQSEHGYETYVGDRGCKLSGGQRQRVSIARAILKNPAILILDEATSALDTESERLVQEALERLMKSRTTIAIAHRLSTIRNADEICVLHEGKIVERGTHDELLALNSYYKHYYDMQQL